MPVINPEVKNIPEFKELFRRDKGSPGDSEGRNKIIANKTCAYIAMMYRPLGAFSEREIGERHALIKKTLKLPEEWEVDNLIEECITIYKENVYSLAVDLLDAGIVAAHKVKKYFLDVQLDEETDRGALKYKASDLLKNVKEVGGVIAGVNELKEAVKKEQSDAVVVRGGGTVGRDEDPD